MRQRRDSASSNLLRSLLLTLLLAVLVACGTTTVPPDEDDDDENVCVTNPSAIITVPDANLRASITTAVRRDTGGSEVLSCANLAQVKQLNVRNLTLSSLEGVQYLVNVTVLTFENSPFPVAHVSKLKGLTKVTRLTLMKLPLDTLAFASSMTALESVQIDETMISNLDPLKGLPNLARLLVDDSRLTTLDAIGGMAALTSFRSLNNPVTTLGGLVNNRSLVRLEIDNSLLTSIGGVTAITTLQVLRVNGAKLGGVPGLSGMPALKEVYLARNSLTSVPSVPGGLDLIVLSYNQITNLTGIGNAASAAKILLDNNRITDLLPLTDIANGIRELDLANNLIWDIRPLAANPDLFASGAWLDISRNCLGITEAVSILYPDNNEPLWSIQGRNVNVAYSPFQDYELCTSVLPPK